MRIIFLLCLASCGQSINLNKIDVPSVSSDQFLVLDVEAENYSYSFTEKECSTEQEATTLISICEIMLDDSLNNDCAFDERENLYQNECL